MFSSSGLADFKLITTDFAPYLERSDALTKHYSKFGAYDDYHRDLHNNYILSRWLPLTTKWFIRSIYTDTLQLLDRSGEHTKFINIPHPDLQATTLANCKDAMLTTLSTSCIAEWHVDPANKNLKLVREMKFSPTLTDSKRQKSSHESKLEAVSDRWHKHPGNKFTAFEKMTGNNPHRYIAVSQKPQLHSWDGYDWEEFVRQCETEDDILRLINAKLYLFDLLHNKSLVVDFPKNAVGFTFLKPNLIAFNDMYGNGFWLCDIHFDPVKGPSIKPHAQQPRIVLPSKHLLVGKDYWLDLGWHQKEPWYIPAKQSDVVSKLSDTSSPPESKQELETTLPDETAVPEISYEPELIEADFPEAKEAESTVNDDMEQALAEYDRLFEEDLKATAEEKLNPIQEPIIRKIPDMKSEFDEKATTIKSILEEKIDPDYVKRKTKVAEELEEEIFDNRYLETPGFGIYQVNFRKDQYSIQRLPCPESNSLFHCGSIENTTYDIINGAKKCDLFHFVSSDKKGHKDQVNLFVPSLNVMVRFPTSERLGEYNVITSPGSYEFTVISDRTPKVIQTFSLPNPTLIKTLDSAFAAMQSVAPMPSGVLDIVRGYVQKEPERFRSIFGLFSGNKTSQSLIGSKNSFGLHFLNLLKTAHLYIQSGIERPEHLHFPRSAPAALNHAEFNEILATARGWNRWDKNGNPLEKYHEIYKKLFYLQTGLIYVMNQCKQMDGSDIENIVNRAMEMLANPEIRFRIMFKVGEASPDQYRKFCALLNNGRNEKILSEIACLLKNTVQTAIKLAPQVEKQAEEEFVSSLVLSARKT